MTSKYSFTARLYPFAVDVVQDFHDVLQIDGRRSKVERLELDLRRLTLDCLFIHQFRQPLIQQIQALHPVVLP